MRALLLLISLTLTNAVAEPLTYNADDYEPPQIYGGPKIKLKAIKCGGRRYGVVYQGVPGSVKYLGIADWEYRMSAPAVMLDDTTTENPECLQKIEKHYDLTSVRPAVVDVDAAEEPAASR